MEVEHLFWFVAGAERVMRGGSSCEMWWWRGIAVCVLFFVIGARGLTSDGSMQLLKEIFSEILNPQNVGWPDVAGPDPCGTWDKVACSNGEVNTLYLQGYNLTGTLSQKITQLPSFTRLDAQDNLFTGPIPSFAGITTLTTLYLANNKFDSIPADCFDNLPALQILSMDNNPGLNGTTGWSIPAGLISSASTLTQLSMPKCNIIGAIPDFLGTFLNLAILNLAGNSLSGGIPANFSALVALQTLKLNSQALSGPITTVGSIPTLTTLWLHQNSFTGTIPEALSKAIGMTDLELNNNGLVGTIPGSFANLLALRTFSVQNNHLVGGIPKFSDATALNLVGNGFCSENAGEPCTVEVTALVQFLDGVSYPSLLSDWRGATPCSNPLWSHITCAADKVATINLPSANLSGTISPFLANLTSLATLVLSHNNLTGPIPAGLVKLASLKSVQLDDNNLSGPPPAFPQGVLNVTGNPLLDGSAPKTPGSGPSAGTPGSPPSTPGTPGSPAANGDGTSTAKSSSVPVGVIVGSVVGGFSALVLAGLCGFCFYKKKAASSSRNETSDVGETNESATTAVILNGRPTDLYGRGHSGPSGMQVEGNNFSISMQVLKDATDNFSDNNILGRGGFGVVYLGELGDGTKIAVKRMKASSVSNAGMDEFQAEIQVLTKVRHRHLVAVLGYCVQGNEKLLVYEYMPQGTLSQRLYEYDRYACKPLSWKQRLVVALDVARGMEYLHGLAHKSFIHRDLKSSNILLGDDVRAKISDFGLLKLAPDDQKSVATRVAGTFGYLAPEYVGELIVP